MMSIPHRGWRTKKAGAITRCEGEPRRRAGCEGGRPTEEDHGSAEEAYINFLVFFEED
jgi:hypothetical protein